MRKREEAFGKAKTKDWLFNHFKEEIRFSDGRSYFMLTRNDESILRILMIVEKCKTLMERKGYVIISRDFQQEQHKSNE